jgi:hypothetical protein
MQRVAVTPACPSRRTRCDSTTTQPLPPSHTPNALTPRHKRRTTQAIEKKGSADVKDWAEYWVVLAAFYAAQWVIDFVLCWLPFYYIGKLGFLLALWHPSTRLAQSLYQKVRRAARARARGVCGVPCVSCVAGEFFGGAAAGRLCGRDVCVVCVSVWHACALLVARVRQHARCARAVPQRPAARLRVFCDTLVCYAANAVCCASLRARHKNANTHTHTHINNTGAEPAGGHI